MYQLSFTPKTCFLLMDRPYTIASVHKAENRTELSVIDDDGVCHTFSLEYLLNQYEKGNLKSQVLSEGNASSGDRKEAVALRLASDLKESARQEAVRKASLLAAIADAGGFQRGNTLFWEKGYAELALKYGFSPPPDRSTILRWIRKGQSTSGVSLVLALAPKHELKGGKGKTRMSAVVQSLAETCLQDVLLANPNTPLTDCHLELARRIHHANLFRDSSEQLKTPSYGQLRRYLEEMDAYDIFASKHGKPSADTKFRLSRKNTRRIRRALERVEVDHTPLDIFIVDDEGVVLGRAYLTLIVDKATRAILGFNIGLPGPSTLAVLRAISHAVRPKTYLRERYPDVLNDWPMYGLFELLVMDNGAEFHAMAFVANLMELEITRELAYMPRRKPFYKGLVETLQKYLNIGVAAGQPGATMSHHWQRNKERPPEEYAVHTLESITRLIHIWVCDVYHAETKEALGQTVYAAWKELTSNSPVRLAPNTELLDLACTISVKRTVQSYGVEVCYLRTFNNDELGRLMRKHMHADTFEVEVRYKPHQLDKVWVKDPDTQNWFVVENYDGETRNSTEWLEQQIHRKIRLAKSDRNEVIGRGEAKVKLRAIGNNLMAGKTMSSRRAALKTLGLTPTIDFTSEPTEAAKAIDIKPSATASKRTTRPKPGQSQSERSGTPTPAKPVPVPPGGEIDYTKLKPLYSMKG